MSYKKREIERLKQQLQYSVAYMAPFRFRRCSITPHGTTDQSQFSQSFESDAAVNEDSKHSLNELGNQQDLETGIKIIEGNPSVEIRNKSRVEEEAIEKTGTTVANNNEKETEEEQVVREAQRKRLEKTAKLLGGVALSLSVPIIIADINLNRSGRTRGEQIILYKASAGSALLSFFAGLGLLICVHKKFTRTTLLLVLIIVAVISVLAGVLLLAINAII